MKSIQLTNDSHLIKAILIWDYASLTYDGSPSLDDYEPTGLWFILSQNDETAGFIHLEPLNNVTWISHVFIFEQYRKNGSEEWGNKVVQFMGPGNKFLAITPYEAAKKYAERMGFKYVATLTSSVRKDGKLLDQYLLEMS